MAYIGKQPTIGNFVKLDAIVTSATATYNLLNGGVAYSPQSPNHCIVSLNGVIQSPTTSFTISGSTIVFASALTATDVIDFILVLGDVLNIGTPSDATVTNAKLALTAGSAGTPTISPTSDTNTGIFFPAADTIGFAEGGTEVMRIDSSGNVMIGNTVASTIQSGNGTGKLVVGVGTGSDGLTIYTGTAGTGAISFADGTSSTDTYRGFINYNHSSDHMAFWTSATERMRITSAGELLVGMTTYGVTNSGASISPTASSSFYVSGGTVLTIGRGVSDGTAIQFNRSGTNCGSISVTSSSTAYNTSSDYRLKENVNYNFDATTRLKQLKPARFNFIIEPNKTVDGFIAHEVQSVIPEAIIGTKDEIDFEGKPIYQGIDQSKLTPILTKALQEAIAKIESLEARLTALENN